MIVILVDNSDTRGPASRGATWTPAPVSSRGTCRPRSHSCGILYISYTLNV